MKIMIVTDAWIPQTNGVVRTLQAMERELLKAGHAVRVIGPDLERWSCLPFPTYSEIKMEFFSARRLKKEWADFAPDVVHIATEGPLGWTMRRLCLREGRPFSTAYHTRFPEYFAARAPRFVKAWVERLAYKILRRFHAESAAVMVATESIYETLTAHAFPRLAHWSRGVDTDVFRPHGKEWRGYVGLPRPILLYVGRVAAEKNLKAFLDLETPGSKVVVGDGPDLRKLSSRYGEARFLGRLERKSLVQAYAAADLFVFPSKTDTFGLVLLEACAAGLRLAAYPVAGPKDVLGNEEAEAFAVLDEDLQKAVNRALALPDTVLLPRAFAEKHSWAVSAAQFFKNLCSSSPKEG